MVARTGIEPVASRYERDELPLLYPAKLNGTARLSLDAPRSDCAKIRRYRSGSESPE